MLDLLFYNGIEYSDSDVSKEEDEEVTSYLIDSPLDATCRQLLDSSYLINSPLDARICTLLHGAIKFQEQLKTSIETYHERCSILNALRAHFLTDAALVKHMIHRCK